MGYTWEIFFHTGACACMMVHNCLRIYLCVYVYVYDTVRCSPGHRCIPGEHGELFNLCLANYLFYFSGSTFNTNIL